MKFVGHYIISAPREAVWNALNDTKTLKACIPGCHHIEWVDDKSLEATIKVNLGVAKPKFVGDLSLSNVDPARSYTLSGQGRGGLLGLAKGFADIELDDHGEGSTLKFTAYGEVSGSIEKIGSKLVSGTAQKVIDRFFEHFAEQFGATATPINSLE
ncbi:CoxG family protein [Maritalea porphyrae]|jgi:carbon monoxide dehydrogenase subunit G|uniref:CoxG family protein n=1 Tax=Maritalea porphyrae TaxID=880732 RepID=UPI0022AF6F96|nr:carbon monoxide dehydrogenase subunit G [Maritalea porphyrae]MCZ4271748.1 carbon monoxide dehydrogenase subunit G [Maritalea porphyrae]